MRRRIGVVLAILGGIAATSLSAQVNGAIAGVVRDAQTGAAMGDVTVSVEGGRRATLTDSAGRYRLREVRSGTHTLSVVRIGYRPAIRDSLIVVGGATLVVDVSLQPMAVPVESISVQAVADPVLDPLATATKQTVTAEDLRRLPVTTIDEAISLSAGAVGQSYRGGRLGQESYVLDGVGVKNQLDAASNSLGIRIPTSMVTEASLTTNAFSARYGQALSGIINVVTKDGATTWQGYTFYESDRLLAGSADFGLDRLLLQGQGPLFSGITFIGTVDLTSRMDAGPVSAPLPTDPLDPRSAGPAMLPHNGGEQMDVAGKLMIPLGAAHTLRLFGLYGAQQGLLYDQLFKYDLGFAPAQRITGGLFTADWQYASNAEAGLPLVIDLRGGWYGKDYHRGQLTAQPDYTFGAFTGKAFHFVGEEIAERLDTAAAMGAVAGFAPPAFSSATPWGVPAFFQTAGSRGEIAFNHFEEFRTQLDATLGLGSSTDLYVGGSYLAQQVQMFQRVDAWLPVGDSTPPPAASEFSPDGGAAYAEVQTRMEDLAFTAGLRYEFFSPGAEFEGDELGARSSLNPRFAVSTVLKNATLVASYGRFTMPPDLQFLVDAAFDDSTRTGRYRRGNPNLGFESSSQYEFSLRLRTSPITSLQIGAYVKRLEGLVSTVALTPDADSSIFANTDYGNVRGLEIRAQREMSRNWSLLFTYVLQSATASSSNPFLTAQLPEVDPVTGDTTYPARVEYPLDYDQRHNVTAIVQSELNPSAGPTILGGHPLGAIQAAGVFRYTSGLPYSTWRGDSLTSLPNEFRLPAYSTVDLLVRKPFAVGRAQASIYLDVRNLFNVQRVEGVRRDTGTAELGNAGIDSLAQAAYDAHPEPIPFESPRYRSYADTDGNGLIEGEAELLPLYVRAARDYSAPIFYYGSPRLFRLGFELMF